MPAVRPDIRIDRLVRREVAMLRFATSSPIIPASHAHVVDAKKNRELP